VPTLRLTQTIRRPIGDVFAAVIDVAGYPRWNPTTRSARKLGDAPTGEGSRFELEIAGFGATEQELQEFERDRRVRLVPHIKALRGGHRFTFTAVADGTQVDHELEMIPRGWFVLMRPFIGMIGRKNLRRTAEALKAHLEAV